LIFNEELSIAPHLYFKLSSTPPSDLRGMSPFLWILFRSQQLLETRILLLANVDALSQEKT